MHREELLKEINKIIMVTSSKYLDDVIESKDKILDCYDDLFLRLDKEARDIKTCDSCMWHEENHPVGNCALFDMDMPCKGCTEWKGE